MIHVSAQCHLINTNYFVFLCLSLTRSQNEWVSHIFRGFKKDYLRKNLHQHALTLLLMLQRVLELLWHLENGEFEMQDQNPNI